MHDPPPISLLFDRLFRQVDREVWVVTAAHRERRGALLATWISQASIDPQRPFVLAGLAPNHFTTELIEAAGCFAIHLPSSDRAADVIDFAIGSGRDRDKLAGRALRIGATTAPQLDEFPWRLECRVVARLDGGDRIYFWGEGVGGSIGQGTSFAPLTEQQLIRAANREQLDQLRTNRELDAGLHGPWFERWLGEVAAGASRVVGEIDRD